MIAGFRYVAGLMLVSTLLLAGCENDIERINMLTDETKIPKVKGTNVNVIYSDSARVKVQVLAPSFQQFPDVEKPYMEFPDSIQTFILPAPRLLHE